MFLREEGLGGFNEMVWKNGYKKTPELEKLEHNF